MLLAIGSHFEKQNTRALFLIIRFTLHLNVSVIFFFSSLLITYKKVNVTTELTKFVNRISMDKIWGHNQKNKFIYRHINRDIIRKKNSYTGA